MHVRSPNIVGFEHGGAGPRRYRLAPRRSVRLPVLIHSVDSHRGIALNISEGGIFVVLDQELPVDSLVEIEFHMPDSREKLRVLGEVRWTKHDDAEDVPYSHGIGIEFWSLGDEGRAHLARFVEAGLTQQPAPPWESCLFA